MRLVVVQVDPVVVQVAFQAVAYQVAYQAAFQVVAFRVAAFQGLGVVQALEVAQGFHQLVEAWVQAIERRNSFYRGIPTGLLPLDVLNWGCP